MDEGGKDPLTEKVIGLAIEVHRALGPGLLESAYEECLCYELKTHAIPHQRQVALPIRYKEIALEAGYRLDIVVDQRLILELKTAERLLPVHDAQLLTYLRLSGIKVGLIMNFNVPVLRQGIRRLVL
jgi:GxxExxY protein